MKLAALVVFVIASPCFATITCNGIYLTDSEHWAHVNDSDEYCSLALDNAHDWVEVGVLPDNYYTANWVGGPTGYCDPPTAAAGSKWFATNTASNSLVTATLFAWNTDPNLTLTYSDVHGFTVLVKLTVSGAITGNVTADEGSLAKSVTGATYSAGNISVNSSGVQDLDRRQL